MNSKPRIRWITRTAIFIALLVVLQAATAPLGNILVTGSIVNLLLVVSVVCCGLSSGLAVGILSPILARILSIGPLWSIIPFIVLGNLTLALLWHFIGTQRRPPQIFAYITACIVAAGGKFAVLYVGIVKLAVPHLLNLPAQQAAVISGMFSVPQLITALIGGGAAVMILPLLQYAANARKHG